MRVDVTFCPPDFERDGLAAYGFIYAGTNYEVDGLTVVLPDGVSLDREEIEARWGRELLVQLEQQVVDGLAAAGSRRSCRGGR